MDAKDIQLSLQGFMYSQTEVFVSELWDLLIEGREVLCFTMSLSQVIFLAQATADGIPPSIRASNEAIKVSHCFWFQSMSLKCFKARG